MLNVFYIILGLLGFSILIIGHELGHFMLAKFNGVKVEEFSIGMGPKIFSIGGKETNYVIKAFPIGGYVKMLGEEEKNSDPRAFSSKSPIRRLSIIGAGPIMNLILALLIFMFHIFNQGVVIPQISGFIEGKPAASSGLQQGDIITKINNKKINTSEELTNQISISNGQDIFLEVRRNSQINQIIKLKPEFNKDTNRYVIGVKFTEISKPGLLLSIKYGFLQTKGLIGLTIESFKALFERKVSVNSVAGPITIIKMSGEFAKAGFFPLLYFIAFISVNLAIFNIIPFPALDGGWIILLLFEIVTRKEIDKNKIAIVNYIGFSLLMMLMVAVTVKDIIFPIKL